MITNSDWKAVHEDWIAAERKRVGEPPTAAEVLAYTRGELSGEDEARVRERLVCYPHLVRTLTTPFPEDDVQPGHPEFLSEHELARHWTALQKRIHSPSTGPGVLTFWRAAAAVAATLALLLGGLLWDATSRLNQPRVTAEEVLLLPDGQRGGTPGTATLSTDGEPFLLVVPLIAEPESDQFRLEIVRATPDGEVLWRSGTLRRRATDTFTIEIPRAKLEPGRYRVVVYALSGAREERLAGYSFRVPAPER